MRIRYGNSSPVSIDDVSTVPAIGASKANYPLGR